MKHTHDFRPENTRTEQLDSGRYKIVPCHEPRCPAENVMICDPETGTPIRSFVVENRDRTEIAPLVV